jgi:hypothetical protein
MTVPLGAAPTYTGWGSPIRLTSIAAPGYLSLSPFVMKAGTSLYFGSDRPGGSGQIDIWVAQWNDLESNWNAPVNLGPTINSAGSDWYPSLSRDEHWLFFASNRGGGSGGYDIWASYRANVHDDFGWETPANLGAPVNSSGDEASPSFFANEEHGLPQLFFTSTRSAGSADFDVYLAQMIGPLAFMDAVEVAEVNTDRNLPASKGLELTVSIRHDGLEMFLTSNRPGSIADGQDIWVSTRDTPLDAWSDPVNAGPVINTAAADRDAAISADRLTLFWRSGDYLCMATRGRQIREP